MVSDLVEAIRAQLQLEFAELNIKFVAGRPDLETPLTRRSLGYVSVEGFGRAGSLPVWEQVDVRVRVYKKHVVAKSPENPTDPTSLYALGEQLRDALGAQASQPARTITAGGDVWLIAVLGVGFDHGLHAAELILQAGRENPAETF